MPIPAGDSPQEAPLSLLRIKLAGGVVRLGEVAESIKLTIPAGISGLNKGVTEVDLPEFKFVGPSLPETMRLLLPFAPHLTKLNLQKCALGGTVPGSQVWQTFVSLAELSLEGC